MRNSHLQKGRRRLFLERLEARYALNADDGLPDAPPPPPPPDPPADTGGGDAGGDSGGDPGSGDPGSGDPPPPDPNDPPPPDPPPTNPPQYPADWTPEQIAAWEAWQAYQEANNCIDGGCLPIDPNYEPTNVGPTGPVTPPVNADAAGELNALSQIFADAIYVYNQQLYQNNQALGQGYGGNISGYGPTCDQVMAGMREAIDKVSARDFGYRHSDLEHYTFATIVAAPLNFINEWTGNQWTLPLDHTYFGIVNKDTSQLEYFMDPWRNGMWFDLNPIAGDPNWNKISWDAWDYVAPFQPDPNDTQPLNDGNPPGDDGHWLVH